MAERTGNRFYPHAGLHAQGTLSPVIAHLESQIDLTSTQQPLTATALTNHVELVNLCTFKEDWAKVIEVSSHAVLSGCGPRACVFFYRSWIEALRASHDPSGLQSVARHMLKFRNEFPELVALATMALSWAGRRAYAAATYRHLVKSTSAPGQRKTVLTWEACAVFLAESPSRKTRARGVEIFARLAKRSTKQYFLCKNYLTYSLECDALEEAATAYEVLHAHFPRASEPYWGAAVLAVHGKRWGEATAVLQEMLADNPENTDALAAMAGCLEKTGDLLAARDLLTSNFWLFDDADYEYNVALGVINRRLFERYEMEAYRGAAIRHLARAAKSAVAFGVQDSPLHLALFELGAGVGEEVIKRQPVNQPVKSGLGIETTGQSKSEQRFWLLSVDDKALGGLLRQQGGLVRCPQGLGRGDVVFLARASSNQGTLNIGAQSDDFRASTEIIGLLNAQSPALPDVRFGIAVNLGAMKVFESPIKVTPDTSIARCADAFGTENFAGQGRAFYNELSSSLVEKIVTGVEGLGQEDMIKEIMRYAV